MDYKKILDREEYRFLRTNEHLGDRIIYLTLGGSHSYGTNIEGSDIDIRGCALERPRDLIGFSNFEQVVDKATDTVIYSFSKLVGLLINCNPNVVEQLGCLPEHYLYVNDVGQNLIDNRKIFLSQRCIGSFGGYAYQQLNRLSNALARDRFDQAMKEEHILNSLRSLLYTVEDRYGIDGKYIKMYIEDSNNEELEKEIFIDIDLKRYPLRSVSGLLGEMNNILKTYGKVNHRNKKKSNEGLNKHAMHLIRLYLTAIDILEKEDIITYRGKDLDLLMKIRNGYFQKEDGTYDDSFEDLMNDLRKKFDYAAANTNLPKNPDMDKIEEFVMEVNKKIILGDKY